MKDWALFEWLVFMGACFLIGFVVVVFLAAFSPYTIRCLDAGDFHLWIADYGADPRFRTERAQIIKSEAGHCPAPGGSL